MLMMWSLHLWPSAQAPRRGVGMAAAGSPGNVLDRTINLTGTHIFGDLSNVAQEKQRDAADSTQVPSEYSQLADSYLHPTGLSASDYDPSLAGNDHSASAPLQQNPADTAAHDASVSESQSSAHKYIDAQYLGDVEPDVPYTTQDLASFAMPDSPLRPAAGAGRGAMAAAAAAGASSSRLLTQVPTEPLVDSRLQIAADLHGLSQYTAMSSRLSDFPTDLSGAHGATPGAVGEAPSTPVGDGSGYQLDDTAQTLETDADASFFAATQQRMATPEVSGSPMLSKTQQGSSQERVKMRVERILRESPGQRETMRAAQVLDFPTLLDRAGQHAPSDVSGGVSVQDLISASRSTAGSVAWSADAPAPAPAPATAAHQGGQPGAAVAAHGAPLPPRARARAAQGQPPAPTLEHAAATKVQAVWRGHRARTAGARCVATRREIRSRRCEAQVQLLMAEADSLNERLEHSAQLQQLQQDTIRTLWREVQALAEDRKRDTFRREDRAARRIQRHWRGHAARKKWGGELRRRLLDNLSGHQRLRAAVRAGSSTALIELCLHLQDQVSTLNLTLTKLTGIWGLKRSQKSLSRNALVLKPADQH